jgi:hypothetical protein
LRISKIIVAKRQLEKNKRFNIPDLNRFGDPVRLTQKGIDNLYKGKFVLIAAYVLQ